LNGTFECEYEHIQGMTKWWKGDDLFSSVGVKLLQWWYKWHHCYL